MKLLAALAALVAILTTVPAEARRAPAERQQASSSDWLANAFKSSESGARHSRRGSRGASSEYASTSVSFGGSHSVGPRPGAWCGWYMRTRHGGGPEMNLAANWRRFGSPASPQVGAIVVWNHHVGEIVGQSSNGKWIVLSGNDSGGVRARPRSIAGATVRM